jgi:parallel beta-helix repeat protein
MALPPGYDGSVAVPLMVYMQGWGGRYGISDGTPYDWNSIWVEVDDPRQTWHYGFNADFDYREFDAGGSGPPATGTIVNFTEQRILQAIDQVSRLFSVDENRIHGHGSSMGGSGMLTMGMRYPNVFAAVYAGLPMTNYETADGRGGASNWRPDLEPKWGPVAANLPVENRGRHAAHLSAYNGTGVWDWMDHQAQAVARRGDDTAYLTYIHRMQDDVIDWETQGQPFPGALFAGNIGFQGAAVPGDHSWPGFDGSNEIMIGGEAGGGWGQFQFRRDMSFPAISSASHAPPVPPPTSSVQSYYYNLDVEWSVPWRSFGPWITDEPENYGITLRSASGSQTADVTPRRLQQFVVTPGADYEWTNTNLATSAVMQTGTATADADGLLTIPAVQILATGNRLEISGANSYFYVATTGDDANPGTAAQPWRTLQHAAGRAIAGDTIIIQPGTYAGGITHATPGAEGRPITYRATTAGQAVIDGSGSAQDAFFISAAPWVVLDGLRIQNAARAAVRVSLSNDVTIRNIVAADNGTWGIFTDYSDDLLIENNETYGSLAEHGIYVSNSGDRPVIRNNRVHDNAAGGIQINADPAMLRPDLGATGDGITEGAVVENNVVWGNGRLGGAAINLASVRNSVFRNNLLYGNLAGGIAGWDDGNGDAWGTRNNTFIHNTIAFDAGAGRTAINLQNGSTGNTVRSNIFAGGGSFAIRFDTSSLAGLDSDYNVLHSLDRYPHVAIDEETGAAYTLSAWQTLTGGDGQSTAVDPCFVDRDNDDYHLSAASPARNGGDPAIVVSPDLAGLRRPQEAIPDRGAFEYLVPAPIIPFPNTADGIHVFSDQLPDGPSDNLLRFIAGHYDGAQKMRSVFTDAVRAYNEDFVMLHYRLAVGHGQHDLLIGDQWTGDWDDVNPNEDWFLHAASDPDRRLRQAAWDWYLMDIGNGSWRDYWLESTVDQMRAVKAQAVFADSWDVAAYNADVLDPWDPRFAGTAPRDNGWTASLGGLAEYMVTGLSAEPEDFLYLPNLGALVTSWDDTDYAIPDGGMVEGFGEWGPGLQGEAADWTLQMNRVLDLAGRDKVLLLQGTLRDAPDTTAGLQHRLFLLGSYLLAKGDYTYINMLPPGG